MPPEIPSYANDEPLPTGEHRVALPPKVGFKIYGDISVAVNHINLDFGMLGEIDYELSDNQFPEVNEAPLIINGLVRVRVRDGLIKPNPDEALIIRRALLDKIAEVNYLRVREEQFHGSNNNNGIPRYSAVVNDSHRRAEIARQKMIVVFDRATQVSMP
jgi:hypothetical protein